MQKMVKKKTWSRSNLTLVCGYCVMCKRQLLSNEGGWIINAEKKRFCEHYGENTESCFDKYINIRRENVRKEI
tara:strand:- start:81 stop:299 length:219 start_codon:yes stop_codon:yes gene_type:complete